MLTISTITFIALAYLILLFLIAYLGDSEHFQARFQINPNIVYALSLAVYCSSWTFYGAVGTAAVSGLDYAAIYVGPILVFLFGYPIMRRIIMVCKQNSITSISDFISSRYGKSRKIAVLVTVIAVVGSLPYIALQLKAVAMSYLVLTDRIGIDGSSVSNYTADYIALYTGAFLAVFAILFGTRHLDTTEHHRGMVLAISFESIVKLIALLIVGFYATNLLLSNTANIDLSGLNYTGSIRSVLSEGSSTWVSFLTKTFLAMGAIILLPRQFQVTVVEAHSHEQFKTAARLMPVYMLITTIIVIPVAVAGKSLLPTGQADLYMLTVGLSTGSEAIGIFAFIGGLSAATGMVIVAVISLSTMVCNDLVMPKLISLKSVDILKRDDLNSIILIIRRMSIVMLIAGAYGYYKLMDSNEQLANIGLVAFASVIQFLPAIMCALFWRRAHSEGVFWGLAAGFFVWGYTLMLPTVLHAETIAMIWSDSSWLHPQALLGISFSNSLTHGVIWSLLFNIGLLVFMSLRNDQSLLEQIQSSRFFHTGITGVSVAQRDATELTLIHPESLRILAQKIIGVRNTESIFKQYERKTGVDVNQVSQVDRQLLSITQKAIAAVIGSASAQKVVSDIIIGEEEYLDEVTTLVDQASSVLQFNRNLLQTTLENVTHGISVVDENLNLVIWNQRYIDLFDYPENFIFVGKPLEEVLEFNAERGDFEEKNPDIEIHKRLRYLQNKKSFTNVRKRNNDMVIKSVGEPMPDGGFVTTYEDITETVRASEMLRQANDELESRVLERTEELEALTTELEKTTRSKTLFLAAASHDLLQPINAARLFSHSVLERSEGRPNIASLAKNIDHSLVSASQLLRALLDISKLDSGGITPELSVINLRSFIAEMALELEHLAVEKQIALKIEIPHIAIKTDRRLFYSVVQNLVTNAIRYTPPAGVVTIQAKQNVGNNNESYLNVIDNGIGIGEEHLEKIFTEFYQIKEGAKDAVGGLGLGLAIVERVCSLLGLSINIKSKVGEGSVFSISLPVTDQQPSSSVEESRMLINAHFERLHGLKILVLDNDPGVLTAMRELLSGWKCTAVFVSSFKDAEKAINEDHFEIILADYRLDFAETGLDFLALVQDHYQGKQESNPEGVLITAEQDEKLQQKVEELGYYYLAKPIAPSSLKSLIQYLASQSEND